VKAHNYTPSKRFAYCAVLAVGGAILTVGLVADRDWASDARAIGEILIFGGVARWAIRPLFMSLRDLYASAHDQGYDQGWSDGRRTARPVVVPMDDYRPHALSDETDVAAGEHL
jgi:hypothetical protein